MGKRGVYTPQMIVNGSRDVLGSNRKEVLNAIRTAARPATILLAVSGTTLRAELPEIAGGCDCDLLLVGILPSTQTAVGRGENAGRLLSEFNVVRQVYALPSWDGSASTRSESVETARQLPAVSLFALIAQRRADARIVAVGVARVIG